MSEDGATQPERDALIEPWMDVLLIGVSGAEWVGPDHEGAVSTMATDRQPPRRPWDVVISVAEGEVWGIALRAGAEDLRSGGHLLLLGVGEAGAPAPAPDSGLEPVGDCDGAEALFVRSDREGGDQVSLRRLLREHEGFAERVEGSVARWIDAGRLPPDLATRLWGLAERERGHWRPHFAPLPTAPSPVALGARSLPEVVVRLVHERALSMPVLRSLEEAAHDRDRLVELRRWRSEEETILRALEDSR